MSREKDLFHGETFRVAGRETTPFSNTWLKAHLHVDPHDHDRRGYPWRVEVRHSDETFVREFDGLASTRTAAKAQAIFTLTKHVNDTIEASKDYQRRKAIYNALSVRDGVPLAEEETPEQARKRHAQRSTLPMPQVDRMGTLSFKVQERA